VCERQVQETPGNDLLQLDVSVRSQQILTAGIFKDSPMNMYR
jgi:hypothetical protein